MFELNIIKSKLISDRKSLFLLRLRRFFSLIAFTVLALMISRLVLLSREVSLLGANIAGLQETINVSKSTYAVNEIEREWVKYAEEIDHITRMMNAQSNWGVKLGILARVFPRGLCINMLSFAAAPDDASKRLLKVDTIVLSKEKPGYELANSLMEELKKTKQFGEEIKTNSQDMITIGDKDMQSISIAAIVQ